MKQVDTIRRMPAKRRRRQHSAEFKAEVVKACCAAGVSVAGVALGYGLNANLVRRWLHEHGINPQGRHAGAIPDSVQPPSAGFVPVLLDASSPAAHEIRIELRRGAATVTIRWPAQAAGECAAWLREWLR